MRRDFTLAALAWTSTVRQSVRPATGPLVIGFVGQLAPRHGVDLLLKAAREMPAGSTRHRRFMARRIRRPCLHDRNCAHWPAPHTSNSGQAFPPDGV